MNTIKTDDPDLYENTGIAVMPSGSAGSMVPGILDGYGIFKNANNKDGAKELVKYLLDKDWYTEWVNETAPFKIPVLQGMKDDEVWQDERNKPFYLISVAKLLHFLWLSKHIYTSSKRSVSIQDC